MDTSVDSLGGQSGDMCDVMQCAKIDATVGV